MVVQVAVQPGLLASTHQEHPLKHLMVVEQDMEILVDQIPSAQEVTIIHQEVEAVQVGLAVTEQQHCKVEMVESG
jgi:hypothetical protein